MVHGLKQRTPNAERADGLRTEVTDGLPVEKWNTPVEHSVPWHCAGAVERSAEGKEREQRVNMIDNDHESFSEDS